MNVLLINPPMTQNIGGNLPKYVDDVRGNIPPLGLLYVATALQEEHDVRVVDMMAGDDLFEDKPDMVGITVTTFTLIDALDVAREVKEKWGVPVMFGGIHPTIYPVETLQQKDVDYVFIGEADELLAEAILDPKPIMKGCPVDVKKLGYPARHLLDQDNYGSVLGTNKTIATMFTSRGCPYKCIFCQRKTMGSKFRARTARQVVDEMKDIISSGIGEILIYDDTFTVDRQRVLDICDLIIKEGVKVAFDIRARVDVDIKVLGALRDAGCKRIHFGVEASSEDILKVLEKDITIDEIEAAFSTSRWFGIETLAYFIIGSPRETIPDIERTIQFAKDLKPDYCHFSIMTPYPATQLYEVGWRNGLFNDYWQEFASEPSRDFVAPHWPLLKEDDLQELIHKAYRSFYWRPSRIVKELIKTRSPRQFGKKMVGAVRTLVAR